MGASFATPLSAAQPSPSASIYPQVIAGGLKVACLSRKGLELLMVTECLAARAMSRPRPKLVFAANGHIISLVATDTEVRRLHDAADLIHADGQPVVFASKLITRTPIPERSATTDFFHDAASAAAKYGLRFFLFGATEEVNAHCAEIMRRRYPGLVIAGRRHGFFKPEDEADICEQINASHADIVWVGLSVPLEQAFCVRNRYRLRVGWLMSAGGCFNYVTGHYRRAPDWMQALGLEWLHRLWREPRRLFWRYLVTNPHAVFLLLTRTASVEPGAAVTEKRQLQHELG